MTSCRSSHQRYSVRKMFLKFHKTHRKTSAPESLLIKLQASDLQLYQKRDSGTGVFLWMLWNFLERVIRKYVTTHKLLPSATTQNHQKPSTTTQKSFHNHPQPSATTKNIPKNAITCHEQVPMLLHFRCWYETMVYIHVSVCAWVYIFYNIISAIFS